MKKVFLTLLAILTVCSCSHETEFRKKAPIKVKTEVVEASTKQKTQTYVGIVEECESTAVSFTNMGVIKRILVNEGQEISQGQLIAEMDDTQARNILDGAEAQMAQANDALERYSLLHENGSLPEVQWVEIQSKVAQAKSQLEIAKKNLADCSLFAPVDGVIGKKVVSAGETATPSQAIVTILDINRVKIKVAIPEAEIGSITTSTPSIITVEAINKQFKGGLVEKGVKADALTHTYEVRINVTNDNKKLLPGMVANVSIAMNHSTDEDENPYTLPVMTVQKNINGNLFVWTITKDNTAHRTVVTIGKTYGNSIAITSGIEVGQRVVTEGYQKLSEGTKVVF